MNKIMKEMYEISYDVLRSKRSTKHLKTITDDEERSVIIISSVGSLESFKRQLQF